MIDISREQMVSLKEASRHLPGRPHYATVWRWATRGTKYGRLETAVIGGQRYTSIESLQRFAEASTQAANGDRPEPRTSAQRERAVEAAEKKLAEMGV